MIAMGGVFVVGMALGPLVDDRITSLLARQDLGRADGWRPATRWVLILGMGVGWALTWHWIGWAAVLPAHLLWVTLTLALAIIDLEHKLVPNRILYPGGSLTGVLLAVGAFVDQTPGKLGGAILGAVLCLVAMAVLAAVGRGSLGMGDVKLSALLGLVCGYQSVLLACQSVLIGFLIGGLTAALLIVLGRAHRHTLMPFAPFLVAGSWWCLHGGIL
jgi:leader peptidase (prepilin peptidase)/N-methyltransferase